MRVQTLAQRMLLITTLALVPAVVILVWNVLLLREVRTSEVHTEARKTAELAVLEMVHVLAGAEGVLRIVATTPVVQARDVEACSTFLSRTVAALPYLASISIADTDGDVWCLPQAATKAISVADRQYFQRAIKSETLSIGLYTVDRITGQKVLPIAIRLADDDGKVLGVVSAYPKLSWFQDLLEQRALEPGDSITMADRDGTILARTPLPERFVGTVIPPDFQRLVRATEPGTEEVISQDGTRRIIGYIPPAFGLSDIYVSAGIAYDPAFALVTSVGTSGLLIWLVGASAAVAVALKTSNVAIVQPFNRLVETVEAWRRNDSTARSGMTDADGEIGRVGAVLDSFMDELVVSRAERLKAEEQRRHLSEELNHRVKNLLTLVQIVARQTFAHLDARESVQKFSLRLRAIADANDLLLGGEAHGALVHKIVENSIGPFNDSGVSRFTITGPTLQLPSASTLALHMALHELCTNATKYGALSTMDGRVDISWSEKNHVFEMIWKESGGPPVVPPSKTGFGSKVIQQSLERSFSGKVELEFAQSGLVCRITAALDADQDRH